MGIAAKLIRPVTIFAVMLSGCGNYDDRTVVFTIVLAADVQQLIDNGYLEDHDLYPVEWDDFYFAETPEMLDSLFWDYPPVLDSLFPEGGSLLILQHSAWVGSEVLGYSMEARSDTVRISVEIRYRDGENPGITEWVFPMGVVLEPETPAE